MRAQLEFDSHFHMRRGVLTRPTIAYETWGRLSEARDNAILIFTGLSPSAHVTSSEDDPAPGWWEMMVGPDRPIDTDRLFVICINSLGSCFGSTGPASMNPDTGKTYRLDFPVLCLEDVARAGRAVVEHLGIDRLYGCIGCSMGGMTALAYAVLYPDGTDSLVCISSAARSSPYAIAMRSVQREIIRKDPAWRAGYYDLDSGPVTGMKLARKLGMITYRSADEWQQRFGRERVTDAHARGDSFGIDFEVESYLEAHAEKFIGSFDANCYLYLSRAMDLFDVADHGGSIPAAMSRIGARRALVMGVQTDALFPLYQQQELAEALEGAGLDVRFEAMQSLQGHDSFLVDMDGFRPPIGEFFAS